MIEDFAGHDGTPSAEVFHQGGALDAWIGRGDARPGAMPVVGTDEVLANAARDAALVLDARSPERFRGEAEPFDPVAGRVPGAVNRPVARNLARDGTFKPADELRAELSAMLGSRDAAQVIHMCGSGVTACHNMLAMEVAGLSGGRLYAGSWSEWCADSSRPVATGA